jgi:esterase/lipase
MGYKPQFSKSSFRDVFTLVTILAINLVLGACKGQDPSELSSSPDHPPGSSSQQPKGVFDEWNKHINEETTGAEIQKDGCWPTHYPAVGPSKGLVVLYHGFTACPQQFFDVAPEIARRGYDVFLPLLPGQGRVPKAGQLEDVALPKDTLQVFRYYKIVDRINRLARAGVGTKIVGGLSGGASLATGSAVEGGSLWNRVLIMAPLFKMAAALGPLTAVLDRFRPDTTINYGEECQKGRQTPDGRRGLCEVSAAAIRTMIDYGILYRDRISELKIPVQFVGAENDPTVNNHMINQVYTAAKKQGVNSQICFYKKGVPHSMMSRRENISTHHWWMDSLESDLINFVTNGTWFSIDPAEKSTESGQNRCFIGQ